MMNISQLLAQLAILIQSYKKLIAGENTVTPQGAQIRDYCVSLLGTDASPKDIVSDMYACAETVTTILGHLFSDMPVITGTSTLYNFLVKSNMFAQVTSPLPGDIIISPTGTGGINGIVNGHVGIMFDSDVIMSNNSFTGNFEKNYTLETWKARYQVKGGYPIYFFRRIL